MTTIYEIYEERVKLFIEKFWLMNEEPYKKDSYFQPALDLLNEQLDFLRQSFIAMVEGEIRRLGDKKSLPREEYQGGWNDCINHQISRLESELSRLKEN